MKLATMLEDVLRSLGQKPVTQLYPFERIDTPQHLRGRMAFNPDECTGCSLCSKDCPANALDLIKVDKAAKRFVIRYYEDRCTFCGQCVESCRFACISLEHDQWELASTSKTPFLMYFGEQADVDAVMGRTAQGDASE